MQIQQNNNLKKNNLKPKKRFNVFWIYMPLILFLLYMYFDGYKGGSPIPTEWSDVKEQMIPKGDVEKIAFITNKNKAFVTIKKERLGEYTSYFGGKVPGFAPQFYFKVPPAFDTEEHFGKANEALPENERFKVAYDEEPNYFGFLEWLLFPLIFLGIWFFIMRRMTKGPGGGAGGGGIFNVGKSQAKVFDKGATSKVTFKDVAGLEEAKVEVMEIVDFLKNSKKYTALGGKIPKGALLVGPPGTGKTLLAKAVAGEADVPFFSISGSDFVEMFVGVGASRVRDLFKQAKEKAPCIVFIDEIDAVGRARSKNAGFTSNDERENTLNQLLTEMDGFGTNSGVIVLAATNRADILDKALMRAGRFDRQINVDLPELKEREEIFEVHLKELKLAKDFDRTFLAKQTPGFSGADIANVCNEAALMAARRNKEYIEKQDFLDAIDRIVGGLEKRSKIITPQEKRTIAYHEAGHATVSWILPNAHPLLKVTIIPRGKALGAAWYLPEERQITTTEQLMDEMAATMGGRAAEEIINGKISTGALSDLEKVTKQAYAMVSYFGMSKKIGNVSFYDSQESGYNFNKPYSEKTAELIDQEAKTLIESAHAKALEILAQYRSRFTELAELLLSREVIFTEDLEKIFGPRQNEGRMQETDASETASGRAASNEADPEAEEAGSKESKESAA